MKKVVSLLLVAIMLFALAACGGGETMSLQYLYNTADNHKAIGEYLQQALSAVGIEMQLTNQEWNTFLNTRKNGEYTVARNGWLADYNDPISFLDMWITDSGNNDVQFGKGDHATLKMYDLNLTSLGYDINVTDGTWAETYDVLIRTIKSCADNAKRYQLMHIAEDMLMDTGCIMPIYYYTDTFMIKENVTGFFANPLGYKYFMYTTVGGSGTTIAVCLASEPDTLDPALNSSVDGATMVSHLFSGLAKWGKNATTGALEIQADCAETLDVTPVVNNDGTVTYTYTLKAGLKWSNGEDLKASDFVYAWNRAASPATAADYGYMFDVVKGYAEMNAENAPADAKLAVTADDAARTITVTLNNKVSYWSELLAFPTYFPVYKAAVEAGIDNAETYDAAKWATDPATYVSNGAYTLSAWTHDSVITLTKNANYHDAAKVTMNEIKCHLSDNENTMLTNYKNGDWQMIDSVPVNEMEALEKDYPNEYKVTGQIGTYYVCFNINKILLPADSELTGVEAEEANQEIRKALSMLIDRNYLVKNVSKAGEVPASSFVPMGMTDADGSEFYKNAGPSDSYNGYLNVAEDAYEANVDAAIEILQKYYDSVEKK